MGISICVALLFNSYVMQQLSHSLQNASTFCKFLIVWLMANVLPRLGQVVSQMSNSIISFFPTISDPSKLLCNDCRSYKYRALDSDRTFIEAMHLQIRMFKRIIFTSGDKKNRVIFNWKMNLTFSDSQTFINSLLPLILSLSDINARKIRLRDVKNENMPNCSSARRRWCVPRLRECNRYEFRKILLNAVTVDVVAVVVVVVVDEDGSTAPSAAVHLKRKWK